MGQLYQQKETDNFLVLATLPRPRLWLWEFPCSPLPGTAPPQPRSGADYPPAHRAIGHEHRYAQKRVADAVPRAGNQARERPDCADRPLAHRASMQLENRAAFLFENTKRMVVT